MGGKHRPGTPKDRALGAELRSIREGLGMSLTQVGDAMGWNISTVSRLERGQRHISPEAVMGLSMVYKLPTGRRDELIMRAKEPVARGWWDRPPAGVPGDMGALASYEAEANRLIDWGPGVIPGLLHTLDYARAVMLATGATETDIEPRLRARRQRQEMLERRGVDYTAYIGIAALHNKLCSDQHFEAQLRHLHRMSRREGVSVRVVVRPTALTMLAWYLMRFEYAGDVVHLEHIGSGTFLFDEETQPYHTARTQLDTLALSERASQDTIGLVLERFVTGKER